jgi:hypothetical protein
MCDLEGVREVEREWQVEWKVEQTISLEEEDRYLINIYIGIPQILFKDEIIGKYTKKKKKCTSK